MSYDLAFWDGPRPESDDRAMEVFDVLMDALEESQDDVPPTPAIKALVDELESRWPGEDPDAPWASFPLAGDAQGNTLYVNLRFDRAEAAEAIASVARRLNIVCFDPQLEVML